MTARNSILLIIKQQPGIEYNALLNKIASNYASIESTRAALSRAIRYLSALGLIQRRDTRLFATAKGAAQLNTEMRNKLLLKLNETVKSKDATLHIDSIVEMLHTLIERSKQDSDLLKAAKGSVEFHIADLAALGEEVEKRIHSMQYLEKVLSQQTASLKQLDFPDYKRLKWSDASKRSIQGIAKKAKASDFVAECLNERFLQKARNHFKVKAQQNSLFLAEKHLAPFLNFVENSSKLERNPVNLYVGTVKIKIDCPRIFIIAPFKQLQQLLGKKK